MITRDMKTALEDLECALAACRIVGFKVRHLHAKGGDVIVVMRPTPEVAEFEAKGPGEDDD